MKLIITLNGGFGNKIFNLLIGLYCKYINKFDTLNILIFESYHDNINDPSIFDIFKNVSELCKIIDLNEFLSMKKTAQIIYCQDIKNIDEFKIIVQNNVDTIYIKKLFLCYTFMYEVIKYLQYINNSIFTINTNVISKEIVNISKTKYGIVHIRYGDKLNITLQKRQFSFIVYTPYYYRKIISKLLKKNINIYIISDDVDIVNKFIFRKITNDRLKILNISLIDSFYLLTKSQYTVLSISTFSFLGTLINNNIKKAYVVQRPNDIQKYKIPEENIISKTNWKKIYNKKYILNYDKNYIKKMLKYRK